jgi:hypothetical protein
MKPERKHIGSVVVKSGQLFLIDPCYIDSKWVKYSNKNAPVIALRFWGEAKEDVRRYLEKEYHIWLTGNGFDYMIPVDNEDDYKNWERIIQNYAASIGKRIMTHAFNTSSYHLISQLTSTNQFGEFLNGVAFATGFDDGVYPVYATFQDFGEEGTKIVKIEVDFCPINKQHNKQEGVTFSGRTTRKRHNHG